MHIQDANNVIKNALSTQKLLQKIKGEALKVNEGKDLDFLFSPGKLKVYAKLLAVPFHSLQALDRKGQSSHQGTHLS